MAPRKPRRPLEADLGAASVRHLLALDAQNVMARLGKRQEAMVGLFSRLRDRAPLMTATHTWFSTAGFDNLARLTPQQQKAASEFYELLGELRWYLQYTEDMPNQLRTSLEVFVRRLDESHRALQAVLGPPDARGAPVVDAEVVSRGTRKPAAEGKLKRVRTR